MNGKNYLQELAEALEARKLDQPGHMSGVIRTLGAFPSLCDFSTPVRTPASPISVERSANLLEFFFRRMIVKADACAWAISRQIDLSTGIGLEAGDATRAKLLFRARVLKLWYVWGISNATLNIQQQDWLRLQNCYRACGDALYLIGTNPKEFERSSDLLELLSESQAAVRAAIESCGPMSTWIDSDQQFILSWCREQAAVRHLVLPSLDLQYPVDLSLTGGLVELTGQLKNHYFADRRKVATILLGLIDIRRHVAQVQNPRENAEHHWSKIVEGVQRVLGEGAPASMPDLIQALLPVADEIPDYLFEQEGLRCVLRYVDQRVAAEQMSHQSSPPARETTAEVLQVRNALRGTRIVLIGGSIRRYSKELLEREFELAELDWQDSREHQSISPFEAPIARPDTKLVILMIRWANHSFKGVHDMCLKYGKLFVRLPGGYGAAQIAHQVMLQVSHQLGLTNPST